MGLGLYLTKYFVEAHFGRVEVESEQNQGSTFKIFLPLELPERTENGSQPGLTHLVNRWKGKKLVLENVAVKSKESSHV